MAYYFVQQYWVLPNIAEALDDSAYTGTSAASQSTDVPSLGNPSSSSRRFGRGEPNLSSQVRCEGAFDGNRMDAGSPASSPSFAYPSYSYASRLTSSAYQMGDPRNTQSHGEARSLPASSSDNTDGNFSMSAMGSALPGYPHPAQSYGLAQNVQRFPHSPQMQLQQQHQAMPFPSQQPLPPGPARQLDFSSQYVRSFASGQVPSSRFPSFQQIPVQQIPVQQIPVQRRPANQSPRSNFFPNQHMYFPTPYGQAGPAQQAFQGHQRLQDGAGSPMNQTFPQSMASTEQNSPHLGGLPGFLGATPLSGRAAGGGSGSIPSSPRGPPRKPKQSGHALWVGNLPPGALVSDLKDHFSKDATHDIESVFLISKSNCAFVNYKTDEACAAAMTRFHDSRFHGVRLVCRLRRTPAAAPPGVPTGPAALSVASPPTQAAPEAMAPGQEETPQPEHIVNEAVDGPKNNDKYFIVKSLTVEDLELSARNGIWATQSHNEEALNRAYNSAENVYLIFSANKSGEYFGYARMESPIDDESAAKLEWAPRTETVVDDPDLPCSIPTPATEFAPRGRIIDDSARGTIFWEAESEGSDRSASPIAEGPADPLDPSAELEKPVADQEDQDQPTQPASTVQAFGKPFKIKWMSTARLPFYRTRGLRNPWNSNREVKIARDGTELETSVGRRLVQMFHRPVPPAQQSPVSPGFSAGLGGPPMGYPSMRLY